MNVNIKDDYFDWMCHFVTSDQSWMNLLKFLHQVKFIYFLDMDANRAEDGIDLRYRFAYENGYSYQAIENEFGGLVCSVFEMMLALAIRCEEHIMNDPDIGDRFDKWFWDMITSLDLFIFTNDKFDEEVALFKIDRFLNREYEPNGFGGLFTIYNTQKDLRTIDIWYQMMLYLNEFV